MRIIVVGLGLRAVSVLERLQAHMSEAEVVAYVDPKPHQIERLRNHEAIKPYGTLEEMLAGEKADLLFVSSPNHMHLEHIRLGLEAGIRMFAEKPVVISMEETMELAELLSKHGADQVLIGLVLRYAQHARDLRDAQAAGQIGDVVSIEANEHIAPYHGAFFMRDWRRHEKYSGGFMLEKCCHDLDIYNMVTGSRHPALPALAVENPLSQAMHQQKKQIRKCIMLKSPSGKPRKTRSSLMAISSITRRRSSNTRAGPPWPSTPTSTYRTNTAGSA